MNKPAAITGPRKQVLGSVFFTVFLDLVGFGMFIPVIPLVARTFGASDAEAVSIASIYSIGTLLAVAVLGRLSDKVGRRRIIVATVAISAVAQIFTGLAQSYTVLLAARLLAGLASGNISVAQACISDVTSPQERGRSMALIGIAFGLGFSLGPAMGALVSLVVPEESALMGIAVVAATLNLINLLVVARRLPETHPKFVEGELAQVLKDLKGSSAQAAERKSSSWLQDFRELVSDKAFRIVLLLGFLQVFGFIGVEAILSLMLADAYQIREAKLQYPVFMFIGISLVLVNGGISRPLLGKVGEVRTLNMGQFFLTLSMIGLPLFAPSHSALYLLLAMMAMGTGLSNPSIASLTSRLAPQSMQGYALGTSQTLGSLARIIGPAFFGALYQSLNGARSLYVSAGLMVIGWLIAFFGLRQTHVRLMAERQQATAT